MSRISLRAAPLSLMAFLAAAPSHAQSPTIKFEGYFARAETVVAEAATPSLPLHPAVYALAPDRIAIAGAAERMPSTAREAVDESVHVVAGTPNLPRR